MPEYPGYCSSFLLLLLGSGKKEKRKSKQEAKADVGYFLVPLSVLHVPVNYKRSSWSMVVLCLR